ncbi:MAG: glycosyltransferase family 4 protein [Rhodocyclaceae bacterium]|nr:glycosyltransferase family 4 protein [Rhodocyclaceae bacterium]
MRTLFIHQNFPGQFRHVVQALLEDPAQEVVGLGMVDNVRAAADYAPPRLVKAGYKVQPPPAEGSRIHPYLGDVDTGVRRGQAVARAILELKKRGWVPDRIVVHPGWGEGLFVKDILPDVPVLGYFEFFYRSRGADVDFDPEYPASLDNILRLRLRNAQHLIALEAFEAGVCPTAWQRSVFPDAFKPKLAVIHEGIDTELLRPDPDAAVVLGGEEYRAGDETVTYVGRNLEPYRGFHVFMRALPELLARRPRARVVIIGGDDVSYGQRLPRGESYRQRLLAELGDRLDLSRVRFTGRLPYDQFIRTLQVSAAHVYLTYPFVLSWSMLEAMACGCVVVGSATPPVQEVIRHGENGLLTDFFDRDRLVDTVCQALTDLDRARFLRAAARRTVVEHYDLRTRCLPQFLGHLETALPVR